MTSYLPLKFLVVNLVLQPAKFVKIKQSPNYSYNHCSLLWHFNWPVS